MLNNANIEKSLQLNKQTRETEQSSSMLEILFDCLRTSNFLLETVKCLDTLFEVFHIIHLFSETILSKLSNDLKAIVFRQPSHIVCVDKEKKSLINSYP